MGEEDCWLFAIETVEGDLTQQEFEALALMIREAECEEDETELG